MRAALNELAGADPEFVRAVAEPEWIRRYGGRAEQTRLPSSKKGRVEHAGRVGADGPGASDLSSSFTLNCKGTPTQKGWRE